MSDQKTNENESQIQDFFKNKTVLITGGTGFFGNILIEKLLRDCPGIKKIYLFVRPRKGKDTAERFSEIFSGPVFAPLTREMPDFDKKVAFVPADLSLPQCGTSAEDQKLLNREINVVFHTAATVRFDLPLSVAINTNTRATRDLMDIAQRMKNLKAFVYVSTAYSNCDRNTIGEEFYQLHVSGNEAVGISEKLDSEVFDRLAPFLKGAWPNSYVYSKCLAEDVIREMGEDLPVAVIRPSIVISTAKSPIRGWINNYYGPTGVFAGIFKGLLKVFQADGDCAADLVPVDYVINAIIACAWDLGTRKSVLIDKTKEDKSILSEPQINLESKQIARIGLRNVTCQDTSLEPERKKEESSIPIYNYVSSNQNKITWKSFMAINLNVVEKYPLKSAVWCPSFSITKSKLSYIFQVFILQLLPALISDSYFTLIGEKARFFKMSMKFYTYSSFISFFCTRQWTFSDGNVSKLWEKLNERDKELFYFNLKDLNWEEYLHDYMLGIREYLLHESLDTVVQGHKKRRRFFAAQCILSLMGYALSVYLIYLVIAVISTKVI